MCSNASEWSLFASDDDDDQAESEGALCEQLALCFAQERFKDGVAICTKLLGIHRRADLLAQRAIGYCRMQHFGSALADVHEALLLDPDSPTCMFAHAFTLAGTQQYAAAVVVCEAAEQTQQTVANIVDSTVAEAAGLVGEKALAALGATIAQAQSEAKGDYDMVHLFCSSTKPSVLGCADYLGPLEVVAIPGKGRGLVATKDIRVGALVLVERAYALGSSVSVLAQNVASRMAGDTQENCCSVQQLCGGPLEDSLEATPLHRHRDGRHSALTTPMAIPVAQLRTVIERNGHAIDGCAVDGEMISGGRRGQGLWRLLPLINHSTRPNVARVFIGDVVFCRTIVPIRKGDEILDNYLDVRMSYHARCRQLELRHSIHVAPEADDMAPDLVDTFKAQEEEAVLLFKQGDFQAACTQFNALLQQDGVREARDPILIDACLFHASTEMRLGDHSAAFVSWQQAMGVIMGREPYSLFGCMLAVHVAHEACRVGRMVEARHWTTQAQAQYRVVYGGDDSLFAVMNPKLMMMMMNPKVFCGLERVCADANA